LERILGFWVNSNSTKAEDPKKNSTAADEKLRAGYKRFRMQYFAIYVVLMLSDWVQGTNMYTLYQSYGVDIGTLFLTGFGASAVFSLFIGPLIDKYGRKRACLLYCAGEVVINILEHSTNFQILLLGRVIGGLTTALLFTSFESWMVTAHRAKGFEESWLQETFSMCSIGNGVVAIFAGLVSQVMADWMGDIGPFRLAIALSALVGVVVGLMWEENYGDSSSEDGEEKAAGASEAMKTIFSDPKIMLTGLQQATFQGAMFTFVFMWVPVMFNVAPDGKVPTGLVYASLMAAIAIGGCVLGFLQQKSVSPEAISVLTFIVATVSMLVPVLAPTLAPTFAAFLVFEMCVGIIDGVGGTIRSKYIPGGQMGAILNFFRVPLNILVVVGTKMESTYPHWICFLYCAVWQGITAIAAFYLWTISTQPTEDKKKK